MAKAKAVPTGIAFSLHMDNPRAGQTKNAQNLDWQGLTTKDAVIRGDEQNRHLVLLFYKPIAFFCLSIIALWDFKSHIETEVLI